MLEISELFKGGNPSITLLALACLYNLVRHALNQYHERKKEKDERLDNERLIQLASDLAAALKEIQYLKLEIEQLKKGH